MIMTPFFIEVGFCVYDICKSIGVVGGVDIGKESVLFMVSVRSLHFTAIESVGTQF
jgi:hypothetical protein